MRHFSPMKKNSAVAWSIAKDNFKAFKNTTLVQGSIPESLADVQVKSIAYLSIDMNCYAPELAAANHFWESISKGGIILLDDYAYYGFEEQKKAFDDFAARKNRLVLSLPTGQGIIIK